MIHLGEIQPIRIGENEPCTIGATTIQQGRSRALPSKSSQRYEEAFNWHHCGKACLDLVLNLRINSINGNDLCHS